MPSQFADNTTESQAAHRAMFGDTIEYRGKVSDEFEEFDAIPYPELAMNRRDAGVWKKVTTREFIVMREDIPEPFVSGQIRFEEKLYVIATVANSGSQRWKLTADRDTIHEVSRPAYRGRS